MSLLAIILLILLGLILILLEFLVVPGVTIAGIGGLLLLCGAVYISYKTHGTMIGNYTLLGTSLALFVTLFFSLRKKTWRRLMLNSNIDSQSFETLIDKIKPGDTGTTISRLNPMGRVMVNDLNVEAKSTGEFIDPNINVLITKVEENKIVVKPLN